MKTFRKYNEQRKLYKKKSLKLEDLAIVHEDQVKLYRDRAIRYQKEYEKEQFLGFWKGAFGFGLGVLITGGIAYGLSRTLK